MRGNHQEIMGLRRAARRVREYFSNKPLRLQLAGHELSQKQLKELISSHHYLLIKSLSAVRMMTSFSFRKGALTPQKRLESSSEPLSHAEKGSMSKRIDGTLYGEGGLSRGRVRGWRLTEGSLVKKQFQSLHEARSLTKRHEISAFLDVDPSQEALDEAHKWQDQLSYKEERQFQITRITKILSD